jgi:hypothetical protein
VSALQRALFSTRQIVPWTRPTTSEIAVVLKAGLAAGIAFSIARFVTDVPNPLLPPATAIVTVPTAGRRYGLRSSAPGDAIGVLR